IHAVVQAVDQIHIGVACRAEHQSRALGDTASAVGGLILGTQIGFGFYNGGAALPALVIQNQGFAQQFQGNVTRITGKERTWQVQRGFSHFRESAPACSTRPAFAPWVKRRSASYWLP